MIKDITNLLNLTKAIQLKYDEYDRITGDSYNVFNLLGLRRFETAHSRVLYNLLNPRGNHKQGPLFLKLFVDELLTLFKNSLDEENFKDNNTNIIKKLNSLDFTKDIFVKREYHLGIVTKDTGGFIDIFIKIGDFKIAIENKIDADDGENQVVRYKNASDLVVYLTKYGHPPDVKSKGKLKEFEDYICISYESNIQTWITNCISDSISKPKIRETLNQYLETIKSFTGQSKNLAMQRELIKIFENQPETISAAKELSKIFAENNNSIYTYVVKEYILPKLEKLNFKDKDFETYIFEEKWKIYDSGAANKSIRIFSSKFPLIEIKMKFNSRRGYNDFIIGVGRIRDGEKLTKEINTKIENKLKENFGKIKSHPWMHYLADKKFNIQNQDVLISILKDKGESYVKDLENEINKMIDFVHTLEIEK